MYHVHISLLHLAWVLLSFVLPIRPSLFLSIMIMLPVYAWEFLIVYGREVPVISEMPHLQKYSKIFDFEMKSLILEQLLFYTILALHFIAVGCFKLTFEHDQNRWILGSFFEKIDSKDTSIFWKFLFYFLKHV